MGGGGGGREWRWKNKREGEIVISQFLKRMSRLGINVNLVLIIRLPDMSSRHVIAI